MKYRIQILNCPVDKLTMEETIDIIANAIEKKNVIKHVVVNAAKIVNMQKDKQLYTCIANSDLINPDGQAVVWASRLLGKSLPERITGIDLMQKLVKLANDKKYKIYFFGAEEEVVKFVVKKYSSKFSNDIIAGYRNGYFNESEEKKIAKKINESDADILFVAMGSPAKEIFLEKYKDIINIPFIMGVGGSFDVVAGKVKRAPKWMQKAGLEWFFRFIQEPRRMWKRYLLTNSHFIYLLLKELFKKK